MNRIAYFILAAFFPLFASSQSAEKNPERVTLAKQIIAWLNAQQADSIYARFDDNMRQALPAATWTDLSEKQLYPQIPIVVDTILEANNVFHQFLLKTKNDFWSMRLATNEDNRISGLYLAPLKKPAGVTLVKSADFWHDNALQSQPDSLVHRIAMKHLQATGTPGMSIGILQNLKAYYYNYGNARKDEDVHPVPATLFEIGSITKTFTAFVLADAVVNKSVGLHDKIVNYLPPAVAANQHISNITLKQLANHTSGLPRLPENIGDGMHNPLDPYAGYDTAKLFTFLQTVKPKREAGEAYEYSNLGFGVLGVILERIYGKPLNDLFRELIFVPFKMEDTYAGAVKDTSITAYGYNDKIQRTPYWNFSSMAAAGAIKSNTKDFLKYALQFTMKPKTKGNTDPRVRLLEEITYSKNSNIVSLGWHFVNPGKPEQIMTHTGGTYGFHSMIDICAPKKLAVVALCNSGQEPGAAAAAREIMLELMK